MTILLLASAVVLAFANGANDNMKGVATLYGSKTLSFRGALTLATLTTAAGSILSVVLAAGLAKAFSAKGLVPEEMLSPTFLAAAGAAAALTVLLATRLGMPISTTHALLGGMAGAGLAIAGTQVDSARFLSRFALPLVAGPLLSIGLAYSLNRLFGPFLAKLGQRGTIPDFEVPASPYSRPSQWKRTAGFALGASPVTTLHVISAGLVGLARGMNDTPKILGLLIGGSVLAPLNGALVITAAMALGGLLAARRVADTLALELTPLTPSQGLIANAATSVLVLSASLIALPVSTTHVSTGGIIGIGGASGTLRPRATAQVASAWLTTVPIAATFGALMIWGLA